MMLTAPFMSREKRSQPMLIETRLRPPAPMLPALAAMSLPSSSPLYARKKPVLSAAMQPSDSSTLAPAAAARHSGTRVKRPRAREARTACRTSPPHSTPQTPTPICISIGCWCVVAVPASTASSLVSASAIDAIDTTDADGMGAGAGAALSTAAAAANEAAPAGAGRLRWSSALGSMPAPLSLSWGPRFSKAQEAAMEKGKA